MEDAKSKIKVKSENLMKEYNVEDTSEYAVKCENRLNNIKTYYLQMKDNVIFDFKVIIIGFTY